jgi:hypothetical protein
MEQRVGKLSDVEQNSTTPKKPFKRGPGRPIPAPLLLVEPDETPPVTLNGLIQSDRCGHIVKSRRSIHPRAGGQIDHNIVGKSMRLIAAWDYWHYPGWISGFVELLEYRVSRDTAIKWLQRGTAPNWALHVLLKHLEQRLAALLRGLDELRDEIKRREALIEHRHGFHVVREDGLPRRGNSNRKVKPP